MTQQTINIGSAPNDGTGDTIRVAYNKCNLNFTELYTAVGLLAPLASPVFTGNPTAPTPTAGDNDLSVATTAFVTAALAAASSPTQPAFRANKNGTAQNGLPGGSTINKITFTNEVLDQGSYYDSTNSRWTPPAGLVVIFASVFFSTITTPPSFTQLHITKNGSGLLGTVDRTSDAAAGLFICISDIANGTDFYEVKTACESAHNVSGQSDLSYFGGYMPTGMVGPQGPAGLAGSVTAPAINCGRLEFVSSTALSFKPYNGDRVKINGTLAAIPTTGIVGLSNTSIRINGTAGQNLAASTLYYVYVFDNAGTLTADFSTTGHSTDTTAGNVGTEIKTGTPTRTLIGMVYTSASSQFQNSAGLRCVLSWFNRRTIGFQGATTNGITTTSTTPIELTTVARAYFLTWADEWVRVSNSGAYTNNVVSAVVFAHLYVDTTSILNQQATSNVGGASYYVPVGQVASVLLTEGLHYASPYGAVSGNTGTYYLISDGIVQG